MKILITNSTAFRVRESAHVNLWENMEFLNARATILDIIVDELQVTTI